MRAPGGIAAGRSAAAGGRCARRTSILTVQLVPGEVSAGQPALAVAAASATSAPVDAPERRRQPPLPLGAHGRRTPAPARAVAGSSVDVDCSLGDVASGAPQRERHCAAWAGVSAGRRSVNVQFALRVGSGRPDADPDRRLGQGARLERRRPPRSCLPVPRTITATLDDQVTALPSPPRASPALGVPCTPLSVAVDAEARRPAATRRTSRASGCRSSSGRRS